MEMTKEALPAQVNAAEGIVYMALELSDKNWKLAASTGGTRASHYAIEGGNRAQLMAVIAQAKRRFALPPEARVMSCYEAGRDGFWLHRFLVDAGVENIVVDSASIEVKRRQRRAKTDRLDAAKLLSMLVRHCRGEREVWQVLRVPTRAQEDARRTHRELLALERAETRHTNRIGSLLALHGIRVKNVGGRGWQERLQGYCQGLGVHEAAELKRESTRLGLVKQHIREIEAQQLELLKGAEGLEILRLARLGGIGTRSAWLLFYELFWRRFKNRREVGSCAGLTGTPYQSGDSSREQGISKAGNKRVRWLMVQLAWGWLRYQPHSALSAWFERRFAAGGRRLRRIGIVALARKLLIAIWRFLVDGIVPEGARLKTA